MRKIITYLLISSFINFNFLSNYSFAYSNNADVITLDKKDKEIFYQTKNNLNDKELYFMFQENNGKIFGTGLGLFIGILISILYRNTTYTPKDTFNSFEIPFSLSCASLGFGIGMFIDDGKKK
ncbi:MAG: hypothetical protein U0457_04635 [Candidatus Sericytochromatia bacterium]